MFNFNGNGISNNEAIISSEVIGNKVTVITSSTSELSEEDLINQRSIYQRRLLDIKNQMKASKEQYDQLLLELSKVDEFISLIQTSIPEIAE